MFAEVIWYPERASTTAASVDRLFWFLFAVCGGAGLLVAFLLIFFAVKYRRRPDRPRPEPGGPTLGLETFWTVTPLVIFLIMFGWGATIYFNAYRPPDDATTIYMIGKQWMWKAQHPGGQREINELHVEAGQSYRILLTSEDVIHSFFVPAFRLHMDVLPGRYTSTWFKATKPGTYHLLCSQYCGSDHAGMVGRVVVMERAEYQRWLSRRAEGSLALEGRKVFLKYRCISCHSADENARAPVLEGLYDEEGRPRLVTLRDGRKVPADEDYIRRSIYEPQADIVAGYENIMPTFKGQVSAEELNQLIAFIKALRPGQTPKRVEEFPPPVDTPPITSKR
jgi:cytochrome c oxidase subunit 2